MMRRSAFLVSCGALAASARGGAALAASAREGDVTTQAAIFAALPRPRAHDWTRIILGSGAVYQKQIGAGIETDSDGSRLAYYELQTGSPGGSCNPSSMRKAYLRQAQFGSLFDTYPLITNIGRTENMVYRYGDADSRTPGSSADTRLRLLDEAYLYDPRPIRITSISQQRIHVSSMNVDTTHVVAEIVGPKNAHHRIRRIELWHSPEFPFGVAKYHAALDGLEPFDMHVYAHGSDFKSLLALTLPQLRSMTRNGAYGQLPQTSVGD